MSYIFISCQTINIKIYYNRIYIHSDQELVSCKNENKDNILSLKKEHDEELIKIKSEIELTNNEKIKILEVDIMYKQKINSDDLDILTKELDNKYEKLKEKYEDKIAVFNGENEKNMGYLNEKLSNANEMILIFQSERNNQLLMTTKHSDELLDLELKKQVSIQGELESQLNYASKENFSLKYLNSEFQKVFVSCYESMRGWDEELLDMVEVRVFILF